METLDVACKSLIDGTNTTRVFWEYYPRAVAAGATDKYDILCRFAKAAAEAWNNKTYTLRSYDAAVSGNTEMTPMDDLQICKRRSYAQNQRKPWKTGLTKSSYDVVHPGKRTVKGRRHNEHHIL